MALCWERERWKTSRHMMWSSMSTGRLLWTGRTRSWRRSGYFTNIPFYYILTDTEHGYCGALPIAWTESVLIKCLQIGCDVTVDIFQDTDIESQTNLERKTLRRAFYSREAKTQIDDEDEGNYFLLRSFILIFKKYLFTYFLSYTIFGVLIIFHRRARGGGWRRQHVHNHQPSFKNPLEGLLVLFVLWRLSLGFHDGHL